MALRVKIGIADLAQSYQGHSQPGADLRHRSVLGRNKVACGTARRHAETCAGVGHLSPAGHAMGPQHIRISCSNRVVVDAPSSMPIAGLMRRSRVILSARHPNAAGNSMSNCDRHRSRFRSRLDVVSLSKRRGPSVICGPSSRSGRCTRPGARPAGGRIPSGTSPTVHVQRTSYLASNRELRQRLIGAQCRLRSE